MPIEHDDKFYRFYRGHWYEVDASRFESIKRIMRTFKLPQEDLQLPDYLFQDTERPEQTALTAGVDYKEANYNTRTTSTVSTSSGWEALLLDRLFISLGKKGNINKFEFADLLLKHQNNFYIIHIKRDGSNALSHHREQVERSADFLASELKRNNGQDLLLKGVIHGLYQSFSLSTKKEKNQGKRLTKGNYFQSLPKERFPFLESVDSDENNLSIFKKNVSQLKIDSDFFEEHKSYFSIALDALYDCVLQKIPMEKIIAIAEGFFESVKQAVKAQKFLFPDGVLSQEFLKNIKIILAVIDDRNIERPLKELEKVKTKLKTARNNEEGEEIKALKEEEKKLTDALKIVETNKKNKDPLFKNQDLWGLDRTRMAVQKYGFGFNLVIINEDDDKNDGKSWDAFGSIVKREEQENSMMIDDKQEPILRQSEEINFPPSLLPNVFQENSQQMRSIEESSQSFGPNTVKYTLPSEEISEFSIYPTIGDGDCFFHAAFTEVGESEGAIKKKAAEMRSALCEVVKEGQYINELRHLVYEHYIDLLVNKPNHPDLPQAIKAIMIEKDEYTATYNGMQKFGLLTETTPNPEDRYSVDTIKSLISHDHIKSYMERFRTVGGDETYIPFRSGIICPAEILAILGERHINIFTFASETKDSESKELRLMKIAGTSGPVVNVLHIGDHFVRLSCNLNESDDTKQAEQIENNYNSWMLLRK
ncbi:hypothetical protein IM40_02720 [Candidatus Paracaedimonas acanthamoebae]|nr:hypothetical protein IM40_02720 [Candidatus Paracaedimonas acanthamoebae]